MNQSNLRLRTIAGLAGMLLLQTACSSSNDAVEGKLTVVDRTTNALTAPQIDSVNGEYSGCQERAGEWSVSIAGGDMAFAALSVILNDTSCVLVLTQVAAGRIGAPGTVTGDAPLPLTDAYRVTPMRFGTTFFANAKLSAVTFAADFELTLLYSDDSTVVNDSVGSTLGVVTASATAEAVPAPGTTIDLDGLEVFGDIDNSFVTMTGSAAVGGTTPVGDAGAGTLSYVVVALVGLDSYAALNAAYAGADSTDLGASIPAAAFALIPGDPMPQTRTLIIANTIEGVRSYKAFEITFDGPLIP